jgi:signal transduction histidine kinase
MTASNVVIFLIAWALGAILGLAYSNLRKAKVQAAVKPGAAPARPHAERMVAVLEQEREQLFADLHDDVGAKLLDLIYQSETPETRALARSALADLRAVVSNTRGYPASLLEALRDIESEAQRRLQQANIELSYVQSEIVDQRISPAISLQLFRIVREAISNVIRHAHATQLRIKVARIGHEICFEIKDDGTGIDGLANPGRGMDSMRNRAKAMAGHITFKGATLGGTRVLLRVPVGE